MSRRTALIVAYAAVVLLAVAGLSRAGNNAGAISDDSEGLGLTFGAIDELALAKDLADHEDNTAKPTVNTAVGGAMRFAEKVDVDLADALSQKPVKAPYLAPPATEAARNRSIHSHLLDKVAQVDKAVSIAQKFNVTRRVKRFSNIPSFGYRWHKVNAQGVVPSRREGHSATAVEDLIVTFGGCYLDKKCMNDVNVFNTRSNMWVRPAIDGLPPVEREGHTATIVGSLMYVYGGSSQVGYLDDVYVLNVRPDIPLQGEEMQMAWGHVDMSGTPPLGREGHSAVRSGTHIILFGGYTEKGFTNELIVLDTALSAWQRPAVTGTKPEPREGHTAIVFKNRMFIFGGFMNGGCLNDVHALDLKTFAWERVATTGTPPSEREDMGVVLRGNEMLITGGCNFGKRKCNCDLNVLNLETFTWRTEKVAGADSDLMTPREDHTMTMVHGRAYIFGGCLLAQTCYNDVLVLEPEGGALKCGGNDCSGHGVCRAYPNPLVGTDRTAAPTVSACVCDPGFAGDACGEIVKCPADCSGHGFCKSNFQCACSDGWTLKDCSLHVTCPGVHLSPAAALAASKARDNSQNVLHFDFSKHEVAQSTVLLEEGGTFVPCAGHGTCRQDGHCECDQNWFGNDCNTNRVCPNGCAGHGVCAGAPKTEYIKRALVILAAEASHLNSSASETSSTFLEEDATVSDSSIGHNDTIESSSAVYCHCDDGFSGIDCSRPRENLLSVNFTISLRVAATPKEKLLSELTTGWGTALSIASSNFLGVRTEHVHIRVLDEDRPVTLLELKRQQSAMLRSSVRETAPKPASTSVKIAIGVECRGVAQRTAVEDQILLPHAAGVLGLFLKKRIHHRVKVVLLSTSFKALPRIAPKVVATPPVKAKSALPATVKKSSGLGSLFGAAYTHIFPKVDATKVAPPHAACPSRCAKHGICNSGTCYCHQGYQGRACTITVRKEFLTAEAQMASQGIVKWAMASFVGGVAIVVGLHPLYSRIRQEQLRKSRYGGAGPMIDMQHRYR
jgi:N-acetylneuraminic acid mutarotase